VDGSHTVREPSLRCHVHRLSDRPNNPLQQTGHASEDCG
jgi:hypothetical protein